MDTSNIADHYITCALWASTDDSGAPMDNIYSESDIHETTLAQMRREVSDFVADNADTLRKSGLTEEQIGHDFWLTRNGHGAGFWDRGIGEVGETLTRAAKSAGTADLYVGDDGQIHQF